ncbi:hypothetical protein AN219_25905, partial [Streptomyces nanshensis]
IIRFAGDELSADEAERLRRLHVAAAQGRKDPQHQMRTLSAQVRRTVEQAKDADRRRAEAEAGLAVAQA